MTRLPLMGRGLDEVLGYRRGRSIRAGDFLAEAGQLAEALPSRGYALNLCADRYRFTVAFAAALMAGQTTLLPPNRLDATIEGVLEAYPAAYVLSDSPEDNRWRDAVVIGAPGSSPVAEGGVPELDPDHLAAVVFTSGSTGSSKAIEKPWYTFYHSTLINAAEMGLDLGSGPSSVVATVPPQHMYGLETSVLMALFGGAAVSSARPFMPADVATALAEVPSPRVLVSTPVHLRALADPQLRLPRVELVWSATAPLDPELARSIEELYGVVVAEIYGCSEVGSLARREPAREAAWSLFAGFRLEPEGSATRVAASHLPRSYVLQDILEHDAPGHFRIIGRDEDLVNVAGKRASLADLNQALLRVPGVEDGVIFESPKAAEGAQGRLVALVVAQGGVGGADIRAALRGEIDETFVPRPIRFVDALPRTEAGKLTRQSLLDLFERAAAG